MKTTRCEVLAEASKLECDSAKEKAWNPISSYSNLVKSKKLCFFCSFHNSWRLVPGGFFPYVLETPILFPYQLMPSLQRSLQSPKYLQSLNTLFLIQQEGVHISQVPFHVEGFCQWIHASASRIVFRLYKN